MALWAFWCVWQGVTLSAWCRLCGVSVSGVVLWLSVWLSGGLLWLWWSSGLAVCLWWSLWLFWCAVRGAVALVLSCCLVSVSSLVVWCAVFWSLVVSSLVWSSGVWSGVWYIISNTLNFYAHEKSATLHDTLPLAYHTINFILELLHH